MKRLSTIKEAITKKKPVNENYGDVIVDVCDAFKKAEKLMKGSSVMPKELWVDVGVRLGHITEKEGDKLNLGTI